MKFMLLSATFIGSIAAAVGVSQCTPGIYYCGDNLSSSSGGEATQATFDAGHPRSEMGDSLFKCSDDLTYRDFVKYEKFCGHGRCIIAGPGKDDYC
ncbi:hypothetical protein C8J57DRAFT_1525761 [Mycena rebaudengoi]|nr:hypothetical protein C8J57DRAFT_1525761 [Mycena rebaudengoi]